MLKSRLLFFFIGLLIFAQSYGQLDSTIESLQKIPAKYISSIDKKVDQYSSRITSKTEKTLEKLSKWENKLQKTLQKINPAAANQLFGNNQLTFSALLQKIKQGENDALKYKQEYDQYRDKLTTSLKYISQQKEQLDSGLLKKINTTHKKLQQLNDDEDRNEAMQQFIKERKKQLVNGAMKFVGKNKYLDNINKEAWYYAETMRNYKELFKDEEKAEQVVKDILNKIPAFQLFIKQNSMLAGLFDISASTAQLLPGMQTRTGLQSLIEYRLAAMGPGAQQQMQQNLQAAHSQINKLHNDIIKQAIASGGSGCSEIPDFKPNSQKTKTLRQRIEYNFNVQFSKSDGLIPSGTEIALGIGYKLNDKSILGLGASYKLGLGSIDNISFTNEGLGLRSFIDWNLKKQFFVSGGIEMNYNEHFKDALLLKQNTTAWQKAALLGLTKKISMKSKWFKTTNMQLLYDFLSQQHVPVSQAVVFRIGYVF